MKVHPTEDRILVRPDMGTEKIAGLEIVREQKNEMQTGVIEAKGPKSPLVVGQRVMYSPAAGSLVRLLRDGEYIEFRILHSDTIQCTFSS